MPVRLQHIALLPAFALCLLCGCSPTPTPANDGPIQGSQIVPLTTVVFSGNRYVVSAELGLDTPVPLMVHGNARMFLMLTHDLGEKLNGGPVAKTEDYGYSSRGKGTLRVPRMSVGGLRFSNLQDVPVFDFTPDGGAPVQGMVGVPFLVAAKAAVDFSRDALVLGVKSSPSPNKRLLAEGYRYIQLNIGALNRVTMSAYFPSLDTILTITPSTVSTALTLHHPLFAGKIAARADSTGPDRSPSGTTPAVFLSDGVDFEVAGTRFNSPASLEDFAEYAKVPASALQSVGLLGYDWMKSHAAVIDYANGYLYFKP